nr:unnamed protein product [Callosobruchus chinensis]
MIWTLLDAMTLSTVQVGKQVLSTRLKRERLPIEILEICSAIKLGKCTKDLFVRELGALSHSRWPTLSNRLLRLYLRVKNPSDKRMILVTFKLKS